MRQCLLRDAEVNRLIQHQQKMERPLRASVRNAPIKAYQHGRRPVLVSPLQHRAESQAENRQSPEPRNTQPSHSESALSETQLAQIQSFVSRSVEQAIAEISSNAARAAVEAMTNTILQTEHTQQTNQSETASTNATSYPGSYLRPALRRDPGARWSRGSQDIKLLREGWTNLNLQCFHFSIIIFICKERTKL